MVVYIRQVALAAAQTSWHRLLEHVGGDRADRGALTRVDELLVAKHAPTGYAEVVHDDCGVPCAYGVFS